MTSGVLMLLLTASPTVVLLTSHGATGELRFQPLDAKEVTLSFSMPSAGVEPIRREARRISEGQWRVEGLRLPVAGRWEVSVDILISDFESVTLKSEIVLR